MHRLLNLAIEERDRMESENTTLRTRLDAARKLLGRINSYNSPDICKKTMRDRGVAGWLHSEEVKAIRAWLAEDGEG